MSQPNSTFPFTIPDIIIETSPYGYVPTEWVTIVFIALFGISTAVHLFQAIRFRLWFLIVTAVFCGLLEIIGWSGRLWSSINVFNGNAFLTQIVSTIIAPTPLVGANFILLGRIIMVLGPRYSRISARWYSRVFLSCDIISLVVQGAGGGIAASAPNGDQSQSDLGGHIMLGGIAFQTVSIVIYTATAAEFLTRYVKDRPVRDADVFTKRVKTTRRMKLMLTGLALMTIFIFIRSIYRLIELSNGWNGTIITTQWLFNVWDGAMIVLAMYTLNVLHPGRLLIPEEERVALSADSSRSNIATGFMTEPKV